jgi:thiamine pyrophosphate-dependent acetolactate synthase large subunit-like protein
VVGEGLGCKGFYAERLEEVGPALAGAKAEKGPAVVCIRSDRDANLTTPGDPLMRFIEVYNGPIG